jgi:hypothetical protein
MAAIVGLIFAGLFGIAGIAILAVSVYSMVYWIRKVKRFPVCEGVVTGFEKVKIASGMSPLWYLEIKFSVGGKQFINREIQHTYNPANRIGEKVSIFYNPDAPQENYVKYWGQIFGRIGGILIGIIFVLFTMVSFYKFFR